MYGILFKKKKQFQHFVLMWLNEKIKELCGSQMHISCIICTVNLRNVSENYMF
jgi:hypothetical protein